MPLVEQTNAVQITLDRLFQTDIRFLFDQVSLRRGRARPETCCNAKVFTPFHIAADLNARCSPVYGIVIVL